LIQKLHHSWLSINKISDDFKGLQLATIFNNYMNGRLCFLNKQFYLENLNITQEYCQEKTATLGDQGLTHSMIRFYNNSEVVLAKLGQSLSMAEVLQSAEA